MKMNKEKEEEREDGFLICFFGLQKPARKYVYMLSGICYLVHGWFNRAVVENPLNLLAIKIRHTNVFHNPFLQ